LAVVVVPQSWQSVPKSQSPDVRVSSQNPSLAHWHELSHSTFLSEVGGPPQSVQSVPPSHTGAKKSSSSP
jgi:hypothetical protein